jgi:hypothetical protein
MSVIGGNSIDHGVAYAGQIADLQLSNAISKLNKSGASIAYGSGVVTDGETSAKPPVAASTAVQFKGIVVREVNRANVDGDSGAIDDYDMTVLNVGVIWVKTLDTVAIDAPVYLRVGTTDPGHFSGVVGTGVTLGVLLPNVKFITGGAAGALVKISIGLGG